MTAAQTLRRLEAKLRKKQAKEAKRKKKMQVRARIEAIRKQLSK